MKKLRFILFCSIFFVMLSLTSVNAARLTECPVKFGKSHAGTYTVTLNEFRVNSVENLPGKYMNRINLKVDISYDYFADAYYLICYDAQGNHLKTINFNPDSQYVDVPDLTAMLELQAKTPIGLNNTYFYCEYQNVYAADGRVMGVPKLQVPIYEMVGWYRGATVYAEDGRTMEISPFQVAAYEAVGCYSSIQKMESKKAEYAYNAAKNSKNYALMMDTVDKAIKDFAGTEFEAFWRQKRNETMDLWRAAINGPLAIRTYKMGSNSIGVPRTTIYFTNVSYKNIAAFKLKFDCYNVFGGKESTYYSYYYVDDAELDVAETDYYYWDLHGADSVNKLANVRITEVVYADGTKWYR